MLKDVVEVSVRHPHKLFVHFEDGISGEVDVAAVSSLKGVFAALCDEVAFASVAINKELGTVQWASGADLDPDVIYANLTGQTVQLAP